MASPVVTALRQNFVAATVLAVASLGLLGCSAADESDKSSTGASVASVERSVTSATPSVTVDQDQRPLIRFDSTEEEQEKYRDRWLACLTEHGVPKGAKAQTVARNMTSSIPTEYDAAMKACIGKQPEEYKDRIARTDHARYVDLARQMQKCVREAGIKISHDPKDDPNIFSFTDDRQVGRGLEIAHKCEKETFAAK